MTNEDSYREILSQITEAWNAAEEDIKLAEQVAKKVIMPSINELRYGGRRLVEIFDKIEAEAPIGEITPLLEDVLFDCLRARHDAIDSAVSKIALDCEAATSKLGYNAVLQAFPKFSDLFVKISEINKNITESRKDRNNREKIYETVSQSSFPELIDLYNEFQASEPIMVALAQSERRNKLIMYGLSALAIVVAIVTAIYCLPSTPD